MADRPTPGKAWSYCSTTKQPKWASGSYIVPLPNISSFSPAFGLGVPVTINGGGFLGAFLGMHPKDPNCEVYSGVGSVLFNGVPAQSIQIINDNQIVAVSPASFVAGPISVTTGPNLTATSVGTFAASTNPAQKPSYGTAWVGSSAASWASGLIHTYIMNEGAGTTLNDVVGSLTQTMPAWQSWDSTDPSPADSPGVLGAHTGMGSFDALNLTPTASDWSIAIRFRLLSTWAGLNSWQNLFWKQAGLSCYIGSGQYLCPNAGGSVAALETGTDYTLIVTRTSASSTTIYYLNGTPISVGDLGSLNGSLHVLNDGYGQGFGNLCDFVRIWNRALTSSEVTAFTSEPYADFG
ncbi:MAG: IPT/TIG domain-containing protein [Capsulimonadaceae bacterium]|nr:IPT/TIG domain-containing protein [Capsulimonadaceae bacterium]